MYQRIAAFFLVFCLCIMGAGCLSLPALTIPALPVAPPTPDASFTWKEIGLGIDRVQTAFSTTTGAMLILYRLSPRCYEAQMTHMRPPKHVSVWGADATGTALLVNGVYFHDDYLPSGFLRVSGTQIGTRTFDQDKTGVLLFHPFRLIDTSVQPLNLASYPEIVQSYPFLLKNGRLAVTSESGKVARRTFIGLDQRGFIYVGVVPYAPISLRELSEFLQTLPIAWTHVLNLDGGPSTGLSVKVGAHEELLDSYVPVPNVLSFKPRLPLSFCSSL